LITCNEVGENDKVCILNNKDAVVHSKWSKLLSANQMGYVDRDGRSG